MQRFARILVVIDEHEPAGGARQELLEFARANAAHVTLAAVCESPDPSMLSSLFSTSEQRERLRAGALSQLEASAAPLREAGLDVDTEVIDGDPLEGIYHIARSGRFDLVAKFAEGNIGDAPYVYGPLDRGLLRVCPLPVLIANPHKEVVPRVLVAVDAGQPTHAALNRQLMAIAASQANLFKAELHVVHAWRLVGETAARSGAFTGVDAERVEKHKTRERQRSYAALMDLVAPYKEQGFKIVEHIVEGSPPKAIAAVAKSTDSDLLVMGGTPRSRFARIMLGDCAVAVLGSVRCSVLLVKTSDFAASLKEHD